MLLAVPACSDRPSDARAARRAVDRYLTVLASHDSAGIRDLATCALSDAAVLGGAILKIDDVRAVPLRALDSLASSTSKDWRASEGELSRATEDNADSLWLRSGALERRAALYRNAVLAARRSRDATPRLVAGSDRIRVCRARVRIRWGGPLVGPEPVDREHVVRLLAAPGGRWIVFSALLRQDDPPAEAI